MKEKEVKVGARVRCIDAIFKEDAELPFRMKEVILPKKGMVYTIRDSENGHTGGLGIRLKEIINKKFIFNKSGTKEPIFSIERFELA